MKTIPFPMSVIDVAKSKSSTLLTKGKTYVVGDFSEVISDMVEQFETTVKMITVLPFPAVGTRLIQNTLFFGPTIDNPDEKTFGELPKDWASLESRLGAAAQTMQLASMAYAVVKSEGPKGANKDEESLAKLLASQMPNNALLATASASRAAKIVLARQASTGDWELRAIDNVTTQLIKNVRSFAEIVKASHSTMKVDGSTDVPTMHIGHLAALIYFYMFVLDPRNFTEFYDPLISDMSLKIIESRCRNMTALHAFCVGMMQIPIFFSLHALCEGHSALYALFDLPKVTSIMDADKDKYLKELEIFDLFKVKDLVRDMLKGQEDPSVFKNATLYATLLDGTLTPQLGAQFGVLFGEGVTARLQTTVTREIELERNQYVKDLVKKLDQLSILQTPERTYASQKGVPLKRIKIEGEVASILFRSVNMVNRKLEEAAFSLLAVCRATIPDAITSELGTLAPLGIVYNAQARLRGPEVGMLTNFLITNKQKHGVIGALPNNFTVRQGLLNTSMHLGVAHTIFESDLFAKMRQHVRLIDKDVVTEFQNVYALDANAIGLVPDQLSSNDNAMELDRVIEDWPQYMRSIIGHPLSDVLIELDDKLEYNKRIVTCLSSCVVVTRYDGPATYTSDKDTVLTGYGYPYGLSYQSLSKFTRLSVMQTSRLKVGRMSSNGFDAASLSYTFGAYTFYLITSIPTPKNDVAVQTLRGSYMLPYFPASDVPPTIVDGEYNPNVVTKYVWDKSCIHMGICPFENNSSAVKQTRFRSEGVYDNTGLVVNLSGGYFVKEATTLISLAEPRTTTARKAKVSKYPDGYFGMPLMYSPKIKLEMSTDPIAGASAIKDMQEKLDRRIEKADEAQWNRGVKDSTLTAAENQALNAAAGKGSSNDSEGGE